MNLKRLSGLFPLSWRETFLSLAILVGATAICAVLRIADENGEFVSMIFVLAVLCISRLTTGYFYGTVASLIGVICVNYVFTYPYFAFNFTISGYPLTFIVMLVASVMTSTMTTQVKQQEHLRAENEKEKARSDLLRSVSHDIRTPLTSIIGATSTILDGQDYLTTEEQRRLLEDTRSEAQWLIRVVENLLSVTRVNASMTSLKKTPELVEEVVGEVVARCEKRFPDIELHVSTPDEPLLVQMDATLIIQVLMNLVENAVKYSGDNNYIELTVSTHEQFAVFSVRDYGVGISPEVIDSLFTPIDRTDTESTHGLGIGLSICRSVIHAHGGQITGANSPNKGAVFTFTLPMEETI